MRKMEREWESMALHEHWRGEGRGEDRGESGCLEDGDLLLPFAFEETLCRDVGSGASPPAVHIWSHPGGLALGLRDSKLPFAREAMEELEAAGVRTAVRHSGGAAVPLDRGVLNVALLLPKSRAALDFHRDFRLLASIIVSAVAVSHPETAARIEAGEIAGSYCPGEYDLAVAGRKFCGIAQRRQNDAYFVHAFIIVSGSGRERGEQVRRFYERAAGGAEGLSYPAVRPETMASLAELGGPGSPGLLAEGLRRALTAQGVELLPGRDAGYADQRVRAAAEILRERYGRRES